MVWPSVIRVARCPVFDRTVRYFGSLSGIILIVIPDNICINSSIVFVKDTGPASVRYFGESHLTTLSVIRLYVQWRSETGSEID